jgi:hypothetical protein
MKVCNITCTFGPIAPINNIPVPLTMVEVIMAPNGDIKLIKKQIH